LIHCEEIPYNAIRGLCTGIVGFFLPQTLAFGYGFIQKALDSGLAVTIPFLLFLALGKILTTSFSIGSGGSGGVFGPSVVIGGAMGASSERCLITWCPTLSLNLVPLLSSAWLVFLPPFQIPRSQPSFSSVK
jgi:H+/Cl- antiporter ClcA